MHLVQSGVCANDMHAISTWYVGDACLGFSNSQVRETWYIGDTRGWGRENPREAEGPEDRFAHAMGLSHWQ